MTAWGRFAAAHVSLPARGVGVYDVMPPRAGITEPESANRARCRDGDAAHLYPYANTAQHTRDHWMRPGTGQDSLALSHDVTTRRCELASQRSSAGNSRLGRDRRGRFSPPDTSLFTGSSKQPAGESRTCGGTRSRDPEGDRTQEVHFAGRVSVNELLRRLTTADVLGPRRSR